MDRLTPNYNRFYVFNRTLFFLLKILENLFSIETGDYDNTINTITRNPYDNAVDTAKEIIN